MMTGGLTMRRAALAAELAVLGVALVWGASYPVAKGALAHMPVLALVFWRFALTAAVMGWIARRELAAAARADLRAGAALGAILGAILLAETAGVGLTSAGNAALVISLCTIFTPVLDFGLRGRLPPRGVLAGGLAAVAGVAVLSGAAGALGPGDLLVLLAAGLRAVMVVATARVMAGRALGPAALTAVQAATVAAIALGLILGHAGPAGLSPGTAPGGWAAIAFLSLFCTIAAFYVQNAALRRSNPTRVAFLMGTEPLFGLALAAAIMAEPVTAATLAGAALIVGGTFLGLAAERGRR
ncbi:DMT family transporter [Frigidibacter sp. MR17.24]|uniref:DMT family transporter n=1 Tax=Frigidibacter sp. MR17.24 TaxID=3127345 RepID=UPI003013046F